MKYLVTLCLMLSLVGCGDAGRAQTGALFSASGLSSICYQGVTYLVSQKGGITVQMSPDSRVVPCTP